MAANGLNLAVGLDITDVQKQLSVLTSTVTKSVEQLQNLANIVPTVNTARFTSAIEDMKRAYETAQKYFNGKSIQIKTTATSDGETIKDIKSFNDIFGDINTMKARLAEYRKLLINPGAGVSVSNPQQLKSIIAQLEVYISRWNTATKEVERNKAAIISVVTEERRLAESVRQLGDFSKLNKSSDLKKWMVDAQRVAEQLKRVGTESAATRAATVSNSIASAKQTLATKVEQEKRESQILKLVEKQDELLRRYNATSDKSIEGLRERYRLSKSILDIQNRLKGTPSYDQSLIGQMNNSRSPIIESFVRRFNTLQQNASYAESANNLTSQLSAYRSMLFTIQQLNNSTGGNYKIGDEDVNSIRARIATLQQAIEVRKADNREKKKAEALNKSLANKEKELAEVERRSNEDPKKFDRKNRQLREEIKLVDQLRRGWESYRRTAIKAGNVDALDKANRKIADTTARLSALTREYDNIRYNEKAVNQNNALFNEQGRILERLRTIASRYISLFTVIRLGKNIAETTGYFEQQRVALEGIIGSASKANKILNQVKEFALETPKTTKELIGYVKQLSAFSIPADELFDTTKRLSDLSVGLGVDMQRLILAYGQVKSASVLRGQELRQFTEAGIPMVQALADKFTQLRGELVSTGEVFELISKRQVPFEMVKSVLVDMTNEGGKFYKMQEQMADTMYGQLQKLSDMWTLTLERIGRTNDGFFINIIKLIQEVVKNASDIFKGLVIGLSISGIGKAISGAVAGFINMMKAPMLSEFTQSWRLLNTQIKEYNILVKQADKSTHMLERRNALLNRMASTWGVLGSAIARIASIAGTVIFAIVTLIGIAKRKSKELEQQLKEIEKSVDKDTNKMVEGLDSLLSKLRSTTKGTKDYNDALSTLQSNYSQYISSNESVIDQLITMKEKYDELNTAIRNYGEYQKQKQKFDVIKAAIVESAKPKMLLSDILGENYSTYANSTNLSGKTLKQKFNDVQKEIISSMLDMGLSTSTDRATSTKENYEVFKKAAQNSMRSMTTFIDGQYMSPYDLMTDEQKYSLYNMLMQSFTKTSAYKNYWQELSGNANTITSKYAFNERMFSGAEIRELIKEIKLVESVGPNGEKVYDANAYSNELVKVYSSQLGRALTNAISGTEYAFSDEYQKVLDLIRRIQSNPTPQSAHDLSTLSNALKESIDKTNDLHSIVSDANSLFAKNIEDVSGKAAAIRATMFQLFPYDAQEGIWMKQWIPTNQNLPELRNTLPTRERDILSALASYGIDAAEYNEKHKTYSTVIGGISRDYDQQDVDKLLSELAFIRKLREGVIEGVSTGIFDKDGNEIQAQLFSIGAEINKATKATTSEQVGVELNEFTTNLKNAFDAYRNAVQSQGMELGLSYMKNDPKMIERFANFFAGGNSVNGNDIFTYKTEGGSIEDIRIGKSGKTLREILKDSFTLSGAEQGVIDFEDAMRRLGNALIEYGDKLGNKGKGFVTQGKQIVKQADEMSKYNVAQWIKDINQQFQDLNTSFERTNTIANLYGTLIANGTAGSLSEFVGGDIQSAYKSNSTRTKEQIDATIAKYNNILKTNGYDGNGLTLGDVSTIDGTFTEIQNISRYIQDINNNFGAEKYGEAGKRIIDLLKQYLNQIEQELSSISGDVFTGSVSDTRKNYEIAAQRAFDVYNMKSNQLGNKTNPALLKDYVTVLKDSGMGIFEDFLKRNDFTALSNAGRYFGGKGIDTKELEGKLDKLISELEKTNPSLAEELMYRKDDFILKEKEFQAKGGAFGSLSENIGMYYNAGKLAKERQTLLNSRVTKLSGVERTKLNKSEIAAVDAELASCNKELAEMGENAEIYEQKIKDAAKANIQASIEAASKSLSTMKDAATALLDAFKSIVSVVNKAYDVMNDGENPQWMQDAESVLSDMSDTFEEIIAPITAVIALVGALAMAATALDIAFTPLLITMAAIIAAAAVVAGIVAAFQQHDRNLQNSIEDLEKCVTEFDNAITNLNAYAERMVGLEKLQARIDAIGQSLSKASTYANMARLEEEKKNTDTEKLSEYLQSATEAENEFLNGIKDIKEEITGSVDDWASSISSALRNAFQNGENAALSFRDTVKTMIGDVIEYMIKTSIIEPLIQDALQSWTNSDALINKYTSKGTGTNGEDEFDSENYTKELLENLSDPKKTQDFYATMLGIGSTAIDAINNLPANLKDFYGYNSESSTLTGGIESITEDTARRIEALGNSQLGEIITIRSILENYLSPGSGFGNSTMANIQTAVTRISSNVYSMMGFTQSILKEIQEVRLTPANPIHVTIS